MNKVLLGTVTIGSLVAGCCGCCETSKVKKLFCECFSIKEDDVYAVVPFTASLDLSNPQLFNNINQIETTSTLEKDFFKVYSEEQIDKIKDKDREFDMSFYFDLEKKKCFAIFYSASHWKININKVKRLPSDVNGLKKYQPNDKIIVDPYPDVHNVIDHVNIYKLL